MYMHRCLFALHTLSKRAALNVTGILTAAIMSAIVFELVGKTLDIICEE